MYLEHFGLCEPPFSLTPNTRFLVELPPFRTALEVLLVGLVSGEGLIKVTGEVGTGKTLLCRQLLRELGEEFFTAYIPNPAFGPPELLLVLAEELGVPAYESARAPDLTSTLQKRLIELHRTHKQVVVLVDEAQAMPDETIETLRLLTNLETESAKLLQLVLFGQPELDARLARRELRQIRQRITLPHRLGALDRAEVEAYVTHRLRVAGCVRSDLFSPGALGLLHHASRGYPRLVNVLGHKALMSAYGRGSERVVRRHLKRAVEDTEDARSSLAGSIRRSIERIW